MTPFVALAAVAFLQAFVVAVVLVPVAKRLGARLGMIDAPTLERKIHTTPIPRCGGLAIFAAFWGCLAVNLALAAWVAPGLEWLPERVRTLAANVREVPNALRPLGGIAIGAVMIFVLGAIDDARGLPAKLRLVVQILSVVPLIVAGVVIKAFLPEVAGWLLTAAWVVLLTNSFNFLDNMNGLTSGLSIVTALVLALLSALAREFYMLVVFALLAGAVAGFWIFNFPKASIFLGDSGSTHLGFLFASLTAVATYYQEGVPTRLPILMPVIVLGVPLFDTLTVLWIRWRTGKPLMEGDRNHISHRLVDLGLTRVRAVLFLYGAALCVGLAAVVLRALDWKYGLLQAAVIGLMFVGLHLVERAGKRAREAAANAPKP